MIICYGFCDKKKKNTLLPFELQSMLTGQLFKNHLQQVDKLKPKQAFIMSVHCVFGVVP